MLEVALLGIGVGLSPIVVVVSLRAASARRWRARLVAFELRFPKSLTAEAVEHFIASLAGLVAPIWLRQVDRRAVVFEVVARSDGIRHHLIVPDDLAPLVLAALRAAIPQATASRLPSPVATEADLAGELGLSTNASPLRTDVPEAISAALLASLQPLRDNDQAVIQLILAPAGPTPSPAGGKEEDRGTRAKLAKPLLQASIRIGVKADPARRRAVLRQITAAFHRANARGVHLYRLSRPAVVSARALRERALPLLRFPVSLNTAELAGLAAFPIGDPQLPGVRTGTSSRLAPTPEIPSRGRVLALSNFDDQERPIALRLDDTTHIYGLAPTGAGKSTLLARLFFQDAARGGAALFDSKADTADQAIDSLPPEMADRVVVFDPSAARPVGLNPLRGSIGDRERRVDQIVAMLRALWPSFWGPRTDLYLRAALATLARVPGMTLLEAPVLLTDAAFRRRITSGLDDVALTPFWAGYESMGEAERQAAIGAPLNKLFRWTHSPTLRAAIGQADPALDLSRVLRDGLILVVRIPRGLVGAETTQLLGNLLMIELWSAAQQRAAVPPSQRRPFFVHIDELTDFLGPVAPIEDELALARGYRVSLTLMQQSLGQCSPAMRHALLANCRTKICWQLGAADAALMAREMPGVTTEDLQNLAPYEVMVRASTGAAAAPPASGVTLPPLLPTGAGTKIRRLSAERYGADPSVIDAAARARQRVPARDVAIGRRPS